MAAFHRVRGPEKSKPFVKGYAFIPINYNLEKKQKARHIVCVIGKVFGQVGFGSVSNTEYPLGCNRLESLIDCSRPDYYVLISSVVWLKAQRKRGSYVCSFLYDDLEDIVV